MQLALAMSATPHNGSTMRPGSAMCAASTGHVSLMIASLPSELQWLVLSYTSLVDLPALNRVCSSFRSVLCELLHPPRFERFSSSSPRSSVVSLLHSPMPPLAAHFHLARPLLAFLAAKEPSYWRLLTVRATRSSATARCQLAPPPLLRRLLRRFPDLAVARRRKQSRAAERLRLVDHLLHLAALLPASLLLLLPRLALPTQRIGAISWPPLQVLPLLPVATTTGVLRHCAYTAALLLAYVSALAACDAHLAVRQRAAMDADSPISDSPTQQRFGSAQLEADEWEEQQEGGWSDSDSDSDIGETATVAEREAVEAARRGEVAAARRRGRVDDDVAFQRRMLRSIEAMTRAREARVADASRQHRRLSNASAQHRSTAAAVTDGTKLASTRARSSLLREDGSSLLLRVLNAALSAVRHELLYRHLLVAAVHASLLSASALLRRFVLLDGIRLLVDGFIPVIPLLAIAHSVLSSAQAAPEALSRLMEQLHHPRIIVALRLVGLTATMAANDRLYRPLLLVFDRLALPLLEALTSRSMRAPSWPTVGSGAVRSTSLQASPVALVPSDHCLPSTLRLLALSLLVSQLLSPDDSGCLDATRRLSGLSCSASAVAHRWLLSTALLHIRVTGGLACSTAVHALLNCTAVLTRRLALAI